jgi:hypothetical protein
MTTISVTRRATSRSARLLRALFEEAAAAAGRTPVEVLLGVAAWAAMATAITEPAYMEAAVRTAFAVLLALPLVYAASVAHGAGAVPAWVRWGWTAAVVAAAAGYALHLFDPERQAELWRLALLGLAALAGLLSVPCAAAAPAQAHRRVRVYEFAQRLGTRALAVLAYAAVLHLGLAGALAAVGGLFDLRIPEEAYAQIAAAVWLLLPPWAVAAGLPALLAPARPPGVGQLRALRAAGLYLLGPLVVIYFGIVYAYAVRMAFVGELPRNLVSPVVLGAGLVAMAALLLLDPLHGAARAGAPAASPAPSASPTPGLSRFLRWLPPLLLPLVALALWAVLARVGQHGWTEFRYLRTLALLALGGVGIAGTRALARRHLPPLAAVPPALALLLVIAAVGPLSAPYQAQRDQTRRLATLLDGAAGAHPGRPVLVEPELHAEILDRAEYLRGHFGAAALGRFMVAEAKPAAGPRAGLPEAGPSRREELAGALGIALRPGSARLHGFLAVAEATTGLELDAGGTLLVVDELQLARGARDGRARPRGTIEPAPTAGGFGITMDSAAALVRVEPVGSQEGPLTAALAPLLTALAAAADSALTRDPPRAEAGARHRNLHHRVQIPLSPEAARVPLRDAAGALRGELLLRRVQARVEGEPDGAAEPGGAAAEPRRRIVLEAWNGALFIHR